MKALTACTIIFNGALAVMSALTGALTVETRSWPPSPWVAIWVAQP